MAPDAALYLLLTLTALILLVVVYAIVFFRGDSPSTRRATPKPEASTPISDVHYASLRAEMAELYVILEKHTTTLKRLSSRAGMQDKRERDLDQESSGDPPKGTPKAEVLRHYGFNGLLGPDFARKQMSRERAPRGEGTN